MTSSMPRFVRVPFLSMALVVLSAMRLPAQGDHSLPHLIVYGTAVSQTVPDISQ
jgi:uncharacterized protein YggE